MTETTLEKAARALAQRRRDEDQAAQERRGGSDLLFVVDDYMPQAINDVRAVLFVWLENAGKP